MLFGYIFLDSDEDPLPPKIRYMHAISILLCTLFHIYIYVLWYIWNFLIFACYKPRWTNFCLVGSLGTSQWEASDIWHFFSCDVRKGHPSKARSIERRNLMHAYSFLFISRVASSKNHTFFNHLLCLTITHYGNSLHIFAQCPFLTSHSIFGHIWPSRGLMWTIGENINKTAFTFSVRKKRIQYFWKNFLKMSSWKIWKSTKRKQLLKG